MPPPASDTPQTPDNPSSPVHPSRCLMGGFLMGLANLVPGISGGTLLLASGAYPVFIEAVADLSRLRLRARSILVISLVGGAALTAIALAAGAMVKLVVEQRWIMYSLFIGLTLGGIPVLKRETGPIRPRHWIALAAGFGLMAAVGWIQASEWGTGARGENPGLFFVAGMLGAAAMILPGLSGAYLLLLLGVYLPILDTIRLLLDAARARDFSTMLSPILHVILPAGIGVLVGVAGVSNAMRYLLERFRQTTCSVLMGLLIGSVVGLWPFQKPVQPSAGEVVRGMTLTAETARDLPLRHWPLAPFTPSPSQILLSLALAGSGFLATGLVARLGGKGPQATSG